MWSHIIGHARQIAELKKTLLAGRLPNAYLFSGMRGIGKRMVANALAAAFVCSGKENGGGCGVCVACRKIIGGTHPDCFVVEPESQWNPPPSKKPSESIKIEQIRELQAKIQYYPLEASAKIAIIDEADRMTASTANSILKILEEPPYATHFVLISTLPHMILPTIRSRCRHMAFGPLNETDIAAVLTRGGSIPAKEAKRIARLAGGSLGTALSIDAQFVNETLDRFLVLMKNTNSADIIEVASEWASGDAPEMRLILDLMQGFYRDILRIIATGAGDGVINSEAELLAAKIPVRKVETSLGEIAKVRSSLDTTANKQLMFEQLLFTLVA